MVSTWPVRRSGWWVGVGSRGLLHALRGGEEECSGYVLNRGRLLVHRCSAPKTWGQARAPVQKLLLAILSGCADEPAFCSKAAFCFVSLRGVPAAGPSSGPHWDLGPYGPYRALVVSFSAQGWHRCSAHGPSSGPHGALGPYGPYTALRGPYWSLFPHKVGTGDPHLVLAQVLIGP